MSNTENFDDVVTEAEIVDTEDIGNVAALVPVPAQAADLLVRPAASVEAVKQAMADYQELCRSLLDPDTDFQVYGRGNGRREFKKKSAWRKLAVAFGVSCELLNRESVRDDAGRIIRCEVLVRATAPNGRFMDGLGVCSTSERDDGKPWTKPEHDLPATAMTRATNRACADLFGMGEVSAEEVDEAQHHDDGPAQWERLDWPDGDTFTSEVERLIATMKDRPPEQRDEFKVWRREQGIDWPPKYGDLAVIDAWIMEREEPF